MHDIQVAHLPLRGIDLKEAECVWCETSANPRMPAGEWALSTLPNCLGRTASLATRVKSSMLSPSEKLVTGHKSNYMRVPQRSSFENTADVATHPWVEENPQYRKAHTVAMPKEDQA
jgi:hypothetical protein